MLKSPFSNPHHLRCSAQPALHSRNTAACASLDDLCLEYNGFLASNSGMLNRPSFLDALESLLLADNSQLQLTAFDPSQPLEASTKPRAIQCFSQSKADRILTVHGQLSVSGWRTHLPYSSVKGDGVRQFSGGYHRRYV